MDSMQPDAHMETALTVPAGTMNKL